MGKLKWRLSLTAIWLAFATESSRNQQWRRNLHSRSRLPWRANPRSRSGPQKSPQSQNWLWRRSPQGSAQSGNYQQYLEQYGGDYQKYMQQGGDVKDSSALNLVAEKQSTGSAEGANYQQYMNYQKYLGSQGDSQGGAQGGNYQQYMQQYAAEYQKYMQKGGGDYQKYMQQGDANNATELTSDDFKQLYAGKWEPLHENMTQEEALHQYAAGCVPIVKNTSDQKEWAEAFLGSAAADYMTQKKGGQPEEAYKCHTEKELKEWRDSQLKQIKTYVPETYRPKVEAEVEAKFNSNLARIRNGKQSEPAVEKEPAQSEPLAVESKPAESERTAKEPTEPELVVGKKPAEETERTESSENAVASTELIARQVAAHNLVVAVPIIGISVFAACAVVPFVVRRRSQHAELEGYLNLAEP